MKASRINLNKPAHKMTIAELVAVRDGLLCRYCGRDELVLLSKEHLVPVSRGGSKSDIDNIGISCLPCNNTKACLTEEEFLLVRHDEQLVADAIRKVQPLVDKYYGIKGPQRPPETYKEPKRSNRKDSNLSQFIDMIPFLSDICRDEENDD